MESKEKRDPAKLAIRQGTLVAVIACAALAASVHPVWWGALVAVILVGVSLDPKGRPGTPGRWDMPDAAYMAVGLAAIPMGITLAFWLAWWWALVGLAALVVVGALANAADKRKAAKP